MTGLKLLENISSKKPNELTIKTYKEKFKDFFNNPPIDDEPWTEEDESDWQNGMKEISEGKVISWKQLQEEL